MNFCNCKEAFVNVSDIVKNVNFLRFKIYVDDFSRIHFAIFSDIKWPQKWLSIGDNRWLQMTLGGNLRNYDFK